MTQYVDMQLKTLYTLSGKIVTRVRHLAEPDAREQTIQATHSKCPSELTSPTVGACISS